jgi:hypothetical protein
MAKLMHTRTLMRLSAAFMALLGLAASFLPVEILAAAGGDDSLVPILAIQIAGALYLGFALVNWMARGILIGGIYARPLALGNFMHFGVAAISLAKAYGAAPWTPVLALLVPYAVFAAWFGAVLFTHPLKDPRDR